MVSSCTSGCPTPGAHSSWGECLRSKGVQVDADLAWRTENLKHEADQRAYASARWQGIQPASPLRGDVDRAVRISDSDGEAFHSG